MRDSASNYLVRLELSFTVLAGSADEAIRVVSSAARGAEGVIYTVQRLTPESNAGAEQAPIEPSAGAGETKRTVSTNEAAAYLGIGRSKFYELVRTQQIKSLRIGRRILIPTRALEFYIRQHR